MGKSGLRLNPSHDARTRAKIQTSQLINRLQLLAHGKVEMPPHAVTAALGLLRKTLPDYSVVQHEGKDGGPIQIGWSDDDAG